MKLLQLLVVTTALTGLAACQQDQQIETSAPTSDNAALAYQTYLDSSAKGHTYSDALSFHSKVRQSEMTSWLEGKSKKSGKPLEEYQKFFLSLTRQQAKCLSLEKLSDETKGKNAAITYRGSDTCTENSEAKIEVVVKMVLENGWKIQSEKVNISTQ